MKRKIKLLRFKLGILWKVAFRKEFILITKEEGFPPMKATVYGPITPKEAFHMTQSAMMSCMGKIMYDEKKSTTDSMDEAVKAVNDILNNGGNV